MNKLIQQQKILKRYKFIYNFTRYLYSLILPAIASFTIVLFYDVNKTLALIGYGILLYALIFGVLFIIPYCNNHIYDLEKELIKLEKRLMHLKAINRCLDECRDGMLFDEDPSYWRTLEKLDS